MASKTMRATLTELKWGGLIKQNRDLQTAKGCIGMMFNDVKSGYSAIYWFLRKSASIFSSMVEIHFLMETIWVYPNMY